MAIDKKSQRMFPTLYAELENGEVKVPINRIGKNPTKVEQEAMRAKTAQQNNLNLVPKQLTSCAILIHLRLTLYVDATPKLKRKK